MGLDEGRVRERDGGRGERGRRPDFGPRVRRRRFRFLGRMRRGGGLGGRGCPPVRAPDRQARPWVLEGAEGAQRWRAGEELRGERRRFLFEWSAKRRERSAMLGPFSRTQLTFRGVAEVEAIMVVEAAR